MEVLPLHKHKELTDACALILNTYWPRSKAAREHSLSQSCDHLPVCLAFVKRDCGKVLVLGFCKVSAVQGIQNACLVESVIVRDEDRGKGLGKVLMNLTEEYVKKLGVQTVYLNTLDKEGFYSKIGYIRCKPVMCLGANSHRIPEAMLKKLLGCSSSADLNQSDTTHKKVYSGKIHKNDHENLSDVTPLGSDSNVSECGQSSSIITSEVTPPPPPPPPPPLQLKGSSLSTSTTYSRSVTRLDPNCVIWMKKDISVHDS